MERHGKWLAAMVIVASSFCRSLCGEDVKYALRERVHVGQQWQVELQTRVEVEAKQGTTRTTVTAAHRFWEKALALVEPSANALAEGIKVTGVRPGLPIRLARYYEQADWRRELAGPLAVAHPPTETRQLRADRRLALALRWHGETVVFCPNGPYTREELDLTQGHLDTLMVPNLLPENLVAVGDRWPIPIPAVQALCGLDGVTESTVQGQLAAVQNERAIIRLEGQVEGIADGSETKNRVQGTLEYDLTFERWVRLRWQQNQQRQAGPITPALSLVASIQAERHFGGQAPQLTLAVVQNLPAAPTPPFLLLSYRAANGACEFLYDRGWHRVAQDERLAIFRLLDGGELVAQMNVTFWPDAKPGHHLTPEQIREFAEKAPRFQLEKVVESGELPTPDGRWIYRHTVQGKSEDLVVILTWYVVANRDGRQVVLVFTTEPTLADKLGGRDLAIVQSVSFGPK
ncbi:hypothetical protein HRbin36_02656 [bacterium HR36]|nr:hypothetical protein HRbin36_02656 [bacterium HR36]